MDGARNVYVAGKSFSRNFPDYTTVKYNASGALQWEAYYNYNNSGSGIFSDEAAAIAVDGLGNVYVTGKSFGIGLSSNYDYATVKYNSEGIPQWQARYNGLGNYDDEAVAIAVDTSNNVYVTGYSSSKDIHDYTTIKYNSAGVEQWVSHYNGPVNASDVASNLTIDSAGNVYVTGSSIGSSDNSDFATIKYNSAGVQQWVARYDGGTDNAIALVVDGSGNVYITGESWWPGFSNDYVTIKYSASGVQQWIARYDGMGNNDEVAGIAIDDYGNVYVTGKSYIIGSDFDFVTIKYNSAGGQEWVMRYNGPDNSRDEAVAMSLDDFGNVYVTGTSKGFAIDSFNYGWGMFTTIKYSQTPAPALVLNTTALGFNNVTVSDSLDQTLQLRNAGTLPLLVDSVSIVRNDADQFTLIGEASFTVEPDQNRNLVVRFKPSSAGHKQASMVIAHNAAGSPTTVNLSGTAVRSTLAINPDPLTFGAINIGDSAVTQIAITNIGSANLTVTNMVIIGKDSSEFSLQGASSFIINIGQEQKVALRFRPRNLGDKNALLKILHDAPGGDITVSLSGRGADFEPPKILTANAPTIVNLSMPILVSAEVTDNYAVQKVWLRYREGGRVTYDSTTMNFIEAHYKANIPGSFTGTRGAEFQIIAIDSSGNDSLSVWRAVRVRLPDKYLSKNHFGGSSQNAYRLISFSLASEDSLVNATLLDDLGTADTTQWRLWDIDPQRRELPFPYREYPNVGDLASGKAMFLITQENKMLTSGAGVTVATLAPFQISLQPGWNMVASPFNFEIPIQNFQPENLRKDLYTYNGVWQSSPSKLQPWAGYMIKVTAPTTLAIQPSETIMNPQSEIPKSAISPDWLLHVEAECENARDYDNFVGVITDAAQEWDRYERFEPPPIGEFAMVSFPHRDWQRYPDVYTTDFRPPNADGQAWDFTVDTNIPGKPVTLRFDKLESAPPELEVRLIDVNLKVAQDLRRESQYVYRSNREVGRKAFRLLVGKTAFITDQSAGVIAVPTTFELAQNFPNPFNPSTSIKFGLPKKSRVSLKIYNLLGKEIATLLDGEGKEAGYHAIVWEGKERSGNVAPSGIYLYRLQAGSAVLTKKLTLIK